MKTCFYLLLILLFNSISVELTYAQQNRSLLTVIKEIEQQSDVKILFREALVSNINVALDISNNTKQLFNDLEIELEKHQIGVSIDWSRNQALLYKSSVHNAKKDVVISGIILDDKTGERLSYATVSWKINGVLKGITSNQNGVFTTTISSLQDTITLQISFVGYQSKTITLDIDSTINWTEIPVRLSPITFGGSEIIVKGNSLYSASDSVLTSFIRTGAFSPLGDDNAIQTLQALPSVTAGPTIQDGLNVRGSSGDGFRVLLDGLTLYNQSHLFGLLDGLNGDILRTSGFFYDITPAQYRAPLGGTLSFITKTGNLRDLVGYVTVSNTALSSTIEGPLKKGKASFLVSARHSIIDQINWFNNNGIIDYGLDINRTFKFDSDAIQQIRTKNIYDESSNAKFYDLHGKVYFETKSGAQLIVSSYLGNDEAAQMYERRFRAYREDFTTSNKWSNEMINLQFNTPINPTIYSQSSIGFTSFSSAYFKEDAGIKQNKDDNGNIKSFEIQALSLQNNLQEFQVNQKFIQTLKNKKFIYGISYSDFNVQYQEISPKSESFLSTRTSQLIDLFSQLELNYSNTLQLNLGSRIYYFSNGKYLNWSPRLKAQFLPASLFSYGIGYSQNFQYLHQLEFQTINSTDFWVLSNINQPPSSVHYITSNIRINPNAAWYFQVEGYYKVFSNLRIHSLTNQFISSFFNDSNQSVPFLYNNDGRAKGMEFLFKTQLKNIQFASTYTLSSTEIENPFINNGEPFKTAYDRTHQFYVSADITLKHGFNAFTSWTFSTGTPSSVLDRYRDLNSRIGNYSRVDFSLRYQFEFNGREKAVFQFSMYNMLNRSNPWYSQLKAGYDTQNTQVTLSSATIYDLGLQPSFRLKYYF